MTDQVNCDAIKVSAYADGELNAADTVAVEAHLNGCAACRARLGDIRAMKAALRGEAFATALPPELEFRVRRAVRDAKPKRPAWQWAAPAGGLIAAAVAGLFLMTQPSSLARDLVKSHAAAPTVEATVDRPWFEKRLGFAPPVLARADGCDLVGGRVDAAGGKPMSAMTYRCDGHTVDFYAWADPQRSAQSGEVRPHAIAASGYRIVNWKRGRLDCYAVSDLDRPRLLRLAQYIQDHAVEGGAV